MLNQDLKYPDDERWRAGVGIVELLHSKGHEAYFVGGCVRDILLGLEPGDYDIATSARPQETLRYFPQADKIGLRYGVLAVKAEGFKYQIATFRRDDPQGDGRRPNRVFFSDLTGDSTRRDFTVNAIYLDPLEQRFLDPQRGIPDLEAKILRLIGDPARRLREDYLRILRAVRFAGKFRFEIEKESFEAIKRNVNLVDNISPDRIQDELFRCFAQGDRIFSLEILHKTGILAILWDIFSGDSSRLFEALKESLRGAIETTPSGIWTAFFIPWSQAGIEWREIEAGMQRINLPRKIKQTVKSAVSNLRARG